VLEDEQFESSRMDEAPFRAGRLCKALRVRLMAEYLGLLDAEGAPASSPFVDLADPVCDAFWARFGQVAANNADLYDQAFRCLPSNQVASWEDLARYRHEAARPLALADPGRAETLLSGVRGFLVEFPTRFLHGADLAAAGSLIPDVAQFPFT